MCRMRPSPSEASAAENKELRVVGKIPELSFKAKSHLELGETLGILDFKAGAKLSAPVSPFCAGQGAKLERALDPVHA